MTTIAKLLRAVPALTMLGCVSDFSPDPYKGDPNDLKQSDSGVASDSGAKADTSTPTQRDASVVTPATDSGSPGEGGESDGGTTPPTTGGGTTPPTTGGGPCDLSGRWIVTEHNQSVAYGAEQVSNAGLFVEITQEGSNVTMSKSLLCWTATNEASNPSQIVAVNMDDSASWPAYQQKTNYNGRKGTSTEAGGGCMVDFETKPLVKGMTVATYSDPSIPVPMDEAKNGMPGWEDWDGDNNPGITMTVSKAADAHMYTAVRSFSTYTGAIAANASNFQLANNWTQDRTVYGSDNSLPFVTQLLGSNAGQSTIPDTSFVEWTRLSDDQATGSDDAICEAIRTLVETLTPKGSSH